MPRSGKALLPHWAQPDHPILQYELAHLRQGSSRRTRFLQLVLLALLLGGAGYLYASAVREPSGATNFASLLWRSLYYPTLLVQVITALAALALGVGSVGKRANSANLGQLACHRNRSRNHLARSLACDSLSSTRAHAGNHAGTPVSVIRHDIRPERVWRQLFQHTQRQHVDSVGGLAWRLTDCRAC